MIEPEPLVDTIVTATLYKRLRSSVDRGHGNQRALEAIVISHLSMKRTLAMIFATVCGSVNTALILSYVGSVSSSSMARSLLFVGAVGYLPGLFGLLIAHVARQQRDGVRRGALPVLKDYVLRRAGTR